MNAPNDAFVPDADVAETDIAIVGMAGRFSRARSLDEFWRNLVAGMDCITWFTEEESLAAGLPEGLVRHPKYVPARGMLEDVEMFDAEFFGFKAAEAQVTDPQQRVFLECAWEALEDAGYDPFTYRGAVGLYAGVNASSYVQQIRGNPDFAALLGGLQVTLGNDNDYLTTRVSYKLNLRGPAVTVQTACSTSLVATHLAVQSLLSGECDMAMAGGSTIGVPQKSGYVYQEDGIRSPDGRNRSFDAAAGGTVPGSGVAVVVLKRLAHALADGDCIHAVIKGSAINNDGSAKVSYMAPSVEGQARCVAEALAVAQVHPDEIGMVEAHGTATALGDPVEVAGLTRAFRSSGSTAVGRTALGSVKSNLGHLNSAAGAAGLIKTVLSLKHGIIPPTVHFTAPNPQTGLADSPFYVPSQATAWERNGTPRRAGVSSLGIGGTNAHVVVEEAPARAPSGPSRPWQLLALSARTPAALDAATANLAAHLEAHPEQPLADAAHTLRVGRAAFAHRRIVLCRDADEGRAALASGDARQAPTGLAGDEEPSVAFLFPGGGAQYAGMAEELYRGEPAFRAVVDECAGILAGRLGFDLREVLFPTPETKDAAAERIDRAGIAHPALFTIEYATARLLMAWGMRPAALIGHSLGEYAAACVAGTFTLEAALHLVTTRGELMESVAEGVMMVVPLPEAELAPLLEEGVSLASINAPGLCVVSGTTEAVDALEARLTASGLDCRRLHFSHASHSAMMDPIVEPFRQAVERAAPKAPSIPFLSSSTGAWITDAQAADPEYWAMHMRRTVRFSDGVQMLLREPGWVLVEAGPGATLARLARRQGIPLPGRTVVAALAAAGDEGGDLRPLLEAVGRCWMAGVPVDWRAFAGSERRHRVPLPTYPFQRRRYWVDPVAAAAPSLPAAAPAPRPVTYDAAPVMAPAPNPVMETVMQDPSPLSTRRAGLRQTLSELIGRLIGLEPDQVDPDATLLELGADSLLLMQASRAIEDRTGVAIPFRMLMGDLGSVNVLTGHIEAQLPPEPVAAPTAPAVAAAPAVSTTPATPIASQAPAGYAAPAPFALSAAPANASALERVVRDQLQLMARQLEMMHGGVTAAPVAPTAPVAAAPAAPVVAPTAPATPAAPATNGSQPSTNGYASTNGNGNGRPAVIAAAAEVQQQEFGPFRPVRAAGANDLDETQRAHLDEVIAGYTARTAKSKQFAQEYRPFLADPRVAAGFRMPLKELVYPIVSRRTQGSRMWDVDGNEYVDFTMGFGVHLFGHSAPFIADAVRAQLDRGFEIGPQTYLAGRVAKLAGEMTGHERVFFCNSGTEAVMAAVRMARAATGRPRIAIFEGSYHGTFDGVLARSAQVDGRTVSVPVTMGVAPGVAADVIVLPYNESAAFDMLRAHAHELAAVLVEPVQSRRLDLQPREFLSQLRALTAELDVALVFDEIINGFRLHPAGAQGWFGIQADLATYGKVVGGGLPIGLVAGSRRFLDTVDGGAWQYGDTSYPRVAQTIVAGTFSKNPLAMAAAEAVLVHLKDAGPGLQEGMNARTARMAESLNELFEQGQVPWRTRHFGSLFRFVKPAGETNRWGELLFHHMIMDGVYVWEGRGCFLSTAHTDEDCNRFLQAAEKGIHALRKGGLLPAGAPVSAPLFTADAPQGEPLPFVDGPGGVRRLAPSANQRQLWVHTRFGAEASLAYNELWALRLKGGLDVEALRRAVSGLAQRHEALRTTFSPEGAWLEIHGRVAGGVEVVDRSEEFAARGETLVDEIARQEKETPFDLVRGPLFRVRLHRLADGDHLMALTFHHLVMDGFSVGVVQRELRELYNAAVEGRAYTAPAGMQLSDFVAGQGAASADELAAAEAYWTEHLAGARPLELPSTGGGRMDYHGARESLHLPAEAAAAVKALARGCGATLFHVLSAAYFALLHRVAAQDDVTIAVATLGRSFDGDEKVLAHAVDLLPLRSRAEGDPAFREMVDAARRELLTAYQHQAFGYAKLAERGLGTVAGERLISATFNLDAAPAGPRRPAAPAPEWSGLAASRVQAPVSYVKFPLQFNVWDTGEGMHLDMDYSAGRFDAATVRGWLQAYATLLQAAAADPAAPLSALPLLGGDGRAALLAGPNDTAAEVPEACLHQLFEARVAARPDAVAVDYEGATLTYAELNARANRVARRLRALGVRPESAVALCLERGPGLVAAMLGVMKAGGAYVALDPAYPQARLAFMLEESGAAVVVTREALRQALPPHGAAVLSLDEDAGDIRGESGDNLDVAVDPAGLAYVIYTSGSTGRSKGVGVPHRGLASVIESQARLLGVRADDRVLQFASPSFDAATFEVVMALGTGAALVTAPRDRLLPGEALARLMAEREVSVAVLPPTALAALPHAALPALRLLTVAGEACPPELAARWGAERRFFNLYGPTEATIWSTAAECGPGAPVTIGRPVLNTRAYVLDGRMNPVPAGTPGELYVGGAGVTRGYLRRPALTAERFVPDPFGAQPGARLYRTGDRARWRADGALDFLGRVDFQVKLRGFRVEPGEVEAAVAAHPAVREAVVVAREEVPGDVRLVAYVVSPEGVPSAALRAWVGERLPEYMVPSAFVALDALPLTPSGKVDRAALPAPDPAAAEGAYTAPRTSTEEALAEVWGEVLRRERVGVDDDFFALGGHSLLAAQIAARVADMFGVDVMLEAFFSAPTVAGLADVVENEVLLQMDAEEMAEA